jgi:hypothetical protein
MLRHLAAVARSIPCFLSTTPLLVASPAHAAAAPQVPPGYYVDTVQVAAPRPVWRDARDGDFTYSVKREFADSATARLLAIAESCYPPRDLLVEIAATRFYEMGSDTAKVPLWWCDGPGVRRVAYAVTAGALDHYLGMTERFRDHDYVVPGGQGLFFTDFAYHAAIAPRMEFVSKGTEYRQVFVAYLTLAWSYDDGVFIDSVQAHRVVVLDSRGNILSIEGDGAAVEDYQLSGHIAVGRRDSVFR